MAIIPTRFRFRRDPAATWAAKNPVLGPGEPGVDSTANRMKLGDGVTPWSTLPYATANVLILTGSAPVPPGTPAGTLIIRTA